LKKVVKTILGIAFGFGILYGANAGIDAQQADPGGGIGGGDEPGLVGPPPPVETI
jgi:hypothetical protein